MSTTSTMRSQLPVSRQRGFTLIELMVAIVVSSIVILGVFAFSTIQKATIDIHTRNIKIQQSLEGAMWTIGQDVRMAGAGWTRLCSELRMWDRVNSRWLNPGASTTPANVPFDPVTGEAYWVLRDGIQAHWKSTDDSADTFPNLGATHSGWTASSAARESAADSFDVVRGSGAFGAMTGAFVTTGMFSGTINVGLNGAHSFSGTNSLAEVRQVFAPGTFFAVRAPVDAANPDSLYVPHLSQQCVVFQVTSDVEEATAGSSWIIRVQPVSDFNVAPSDLLAASAVATHAAVPQDWEPFADQAGNMVIPLGHLRWSRYEIDYTVPSIPYLVRYEFIDAQAGEEVTGLAVDYPGCEPGSGTCPLPGLHLTTTTAALPQATAVAPVIEDMQVAVGCDGYGSGGGPANVPAPEAGFLDPGPFVGTNAGNPDLAINEATNESGFRGGTNNGDEWLGNARDDNWSPDCVVGGTGQERPGDWTTLENGRYPGVALYRMSPQSVRITLTGTSEGPSGPGGLASVTLPAVEDREPVTQPAGTADPRDHITLTERFSPRNLRWRDTRVP